MKEFIKALNEIGPVGQISLGICITTLLFVVAGSVKMAVQAVKWLLRWNARRYRPENSFLSQVQYYHGIRSSGPSHERVPGTVGICLGTIATMPISAAVGAAYGEGPVIIFLRVAGVAVVCEVVMRLGWRFVSKHRAPVRKTP